LAETTRLTAHAPSDSDWSVNDAIRVRIASPDVPSHGYGRALSYRS